MGLSAVFLSSSFPNVYNKHRWFEMYAVLVNINRPEWLFAEWLEAQPRYLVLTFALSKQNNDILIANISNYWSLQLHSLFRDWAAPDCDTVHN